jgi:prefoldin beta subunit
VSAPLGRKHGPPLTPHIELSAAVEARQRLESQQQENTTVKNEFGLLADDATIYKQIGPVLLKQEKTEALMGVNGRLEFIENEIKRFETQIKGIQEKSEKAKIEVRLLRAQKSCQRLANRPSRSCKYSRPHSRRSRPHRHREPRSIRKSQDSSKTRYPFRSSTMPPLRQVN